MTIRLYARLRRTLSEDQEADTALALVTLDLRDPQARACCVSSLDLRRCSSFRGSLGSANAGA